MPTVFISTSKVWLAVEEVAAAVGSVIVHDLLEPLTVQPEDDVTVSVIYPVSGVMLTVTFAPGGRFVSVPPSCAVVVP